MLMSNSRLHAQKHARLKSPQRGFVGSVCLCVVRFIFDPTRAVTQTQQLLFFCVVHKLFFFYIYIYILLPTSVLEQAPAPGL